MSKQRFITEVWDYRLSTAAPILYKGLPPQETPKGNKDTSLFHNWVVCIYDQGEKRNSPLELFNTGIEVIKGDDANWQKGHDECYKFLREVRDKYSRTNIEELKPVVAEIRKYDNLRQKATEAYNQVIKEGT